MDRTDTDRDGQGVRRGGYLDQPSEVCSIARSVALVGDRWALLVLRDVGNGVRRFDELAQHLGVARDVLTRRLNVLVGEGLVERRPYQEAGQRQRSEYRLTDKGRDFVPVLVALMQWGDRHLADEAGPPVRLYHADCGAPLSLELRCAAGHAVQPGRAVDRVYQLADTVAP
jgi:DNA-binding HxlR family transcriptional regulator